jgi:DNA topoisomerase VI subunit B
MMKSELKSIRDQWQQPHPWHVETDDTSIKVMDEDGECVVSSILHSHVEDVVEDHIKKVQTEVALQLLLSTSDETEM